MRNIKKKLPNCLTVLPEKRIIKEVGAEYLSELVDVLKSYCNMSINELSKYCSSKKNVKRFIKGIITLFIVYIG